MTAGQRTIIDAGDDLASAARSFRAPLGAAPVVDAPRHAATHAGDQHPGLAPTGHAHLMTGPLGDGRADGAA